MQLLVERIEIGIAELTIRFRDNGLAQVTAEVVNLADSYQSAAA